MTSFLSWAMSLIAAPPVFQPPEIPTGTAWCSGCDRWTERDALPGTSFGGKDIPTWYFCVWCGVCDFDYVAEPEPEDGAA